MSFAKLLTTVLLAAYTLAAPMALLDTVTNTADNTVDSNLVSSVTGGGDLLGGLPIVGPLLGGLSVKRDGSAVIVDTATNTVDNIVGSNPVITTLNGLPIVGGLLGGLGPKRDVPSTAALSQEAVAALVKEGSTVIAVSHTGETQDVTDILKSSLSTRDLVGNAEGDVTSLSGGLLATNDLAGILTVLHNGGKLAAVEPSEKVHDITNTFVPVLNHRRFIGVGSTLSDLVGEVDEVEDDVNTAATGIFSNADNLPLPNV